FCLVTLFTFVSQEVEDLGERHIVERDFRQDDFSQLCFELPATLMLMSPWHHRQIAPSWPGSSGYFAPSRESISSRKRIFRRRLGCSGLRNWRRPGGTCPGR